MIPFFFTYVYSKPNKHVRTIKYSYNVPQLHLFSYRIHAKVLVTQKRKGCFKIHPLSSTIFTDRTSSSPNIIYIRKCDCETSFPLTFFVHCSPRLVSADITVPQSQRHKVVTGSDYNNQSCHSSLQNEVSSPFTLL